MNHQHISADWVYYDGQLYANWCLKFNPEGILTQIGPTTLGDNLDSFHFSGVVCPGFVNAHCHLELSYLKGKIERHTGMVPFLKAVGELRNSVDLAARIDSISLQILELIESGTEAVVDICNSTDSLAIKEKYSLATYNLFEIFGLNPVIAKSRIELAKEWQQQWPTPSGIVPHAPYSLLPETMAEIAKIALAVNGIISIHSLESQAEIDFFQRRGDFLPFFESIGVQYQPIYSHPLDFVFQYFNSQHQLLYVHLTDATESDIERIRHHTPNFGLVLCLRANEYIQNKRPSASIFDWKNDTILVGTDSLASNDDLKLFNELKALQDWNPGLTLQQMLKIAVDNPRRFLSDMLKMSNFKVGTRPFVTGISDINPHNLRLTHSSQAICLQS